MSVVVNVGSTPATVALSGDQDLLFTSPAGATLVAEGLDLPPHAGAVVRRRR